MKYIPADKLIVEIERRKVILDKYKDSFETAACCKQELKWMEDFISSLQQEQPMPDSTQLIEFWNEDKEILKEKDFRDDAWRLAYNAFMCGFGRGLAVKRAQPEVDLEKEIERIVKNEEKFMKFQVRHQLIGYVARHFYELGLNARKDD